MVPTREKKPHNGRFLSLLEEPFKIFFNGSVIEACEAKNGTVETQKDVFNNSNGRAMPVKASGNSTQVT